MHDMQTSEPTRRGPKAIRQTGILLGGLALVIAAGWFWQTGRGGSLASSPSAIPAASETEFMPKIHKTDEQWRDQLTPEQYEVTRQKGTERAFTGKYWDHKEQGRYKCVCCGAELFTSDTKYDSGCGWPSFFATDKPDNLHTEEDRSWGMVRTEVMCKQCGAHLGHVFDDGPQPTGTRYCMNSAALDFEKKVDAEKVEQAKSEEKE